MINSTKPTPVTDSPQNGEHSVSAPASWSLLSRTLPEIFQLSLYCDSSLNYDEEITIENLGISPADLDQLSKIALFPESSADFLFSITIGYLLQVDISNDTLSIILDHLAYRSELTDRTSMFLSDSNISSASIYGEIQTNLFEDFRIERFPYPDLIPKSKKPAATWGQIALVSERDIINYYGFTVKGLVAIKYLWQLKNKAFELQNTILIGLPLVMYCEFDTLVNIFLKTIAKTDREFLILKGRLGLIDDRERTLEELGQHENVTRERIRQIEKKLMSILMRPDRLDQLSFFWLTVKEILASGGGVYCVIEIANLLKNRWAWTKLPSVRALASFINLSANYEVIWADPIRVLMPNHMCVKCHEIRSALKRAVESQKNGMLLFQDASTITHDFCESQHCEQLPDIIKLSDGFFHLLDDLIGEIFADDNTFYTQDAWNQKHGKGRLLLVETILRAARRPMHFREVHVKANENKPVNQQLSERNVYSYIERSTNLLLWDRGTYIHRDYVKIPTELIENIEHEIITRLESHIPYLSVSGIFELFKNSLLKNNIPSESALYSCLRESNHKALGFPEYPYITNSGMETHRIPVPMVLEEYILNKEKTINYKELRDYAVKTLCLNEAVFYANHFQDIPNLLRISQSEYIHLSQLDIDKSTLEPVIDYLRMLLDSSSHVSVIKIYNDKKITCKLLGITTPYLLFSLIQHFYSDQFRPLRYPKIGLASPAKEKTRTTGVASEIIHYMIEKRVPCSYAELCQRFVTELGYNENSVYSISINNEILRYSEGVVVHLESLVWNEEKQIILESLAIGHLNNRNNAGKPFGLISHLYNYVHDQLPDIPDQISWTPSLIGELISRRGRYKIIGTQRNAFVSIPNLHDIQSLDDLLYYILDSDYDGAANMNQFILDMREAGILKKGLTSSMLGATSRVVIDGNVVRLARLK